MAIVREKLNVFKMFVRRYMRITPALGLIILLNDCLSTQIAKNGDDLFLDYSVNPCRKYWWSAILHIQNFVNPHAMVKS